MGTKLKLLGCTAVGALSVTAAPVTAGPLTSVTSGVSAATVAAPAGSGDLTPQYRNINPFYRNIGAFWGDVNPFYRNIGAFWGDIDPFYRNIGAFWGDLNPLYRNIGAFGGGIVPEYRNIGAFWEQTGTLWGNISADWASAATSRSGPATYQSVAAQLLDLRTRSESYWGAAVAAQTGKSFAAGFADPLFAKYGLDLANPASLQNLPANEREHFFMDWYDGLMNFSGTDHVDHWMKTINWTPQLTQVQGSGADAVIGLVDFYIAGDADLQSKTIYNGGVSKYSNGHGAAVGSLIASAHDGKGVMGIAPNARIAAYNPFDASGTADWPDIKAGIVAVTKAGAGVVNLSLGVPGVTFDQGWKGVFADPAVKLASTKAVYVIAAGNDGVTQTQNVDLTGARDTAFILVGSVDPTGKISDFSNRPGTACVTELNICQSKLKGSDSSLLMNRFIVAPGELILVSDDHGGTTRMSGTSFAAPLVSGAIALLQDRWPWLKNYPTQVASVILGSAKDLGAAGVDPVYGVGLLDVEASQSPLSFDALKYYIVGSDGKQAEVKVAQIKAAANQTAWSNGDFYLSAFEDLGGGAKRDFLIPLNSRFVGMKQGGEYFQQYVYNRMVTWLGGSTAGVAGFTDVPSVALTSPTEGWRMAMSANLRDGYQTRSGFVRPGVSSALRFASPTGKLAFTFGNGDGAAVVGAQAGFGLRSDYDALSGGVNPVLGFANGGTHASLQLAVRHDLTISGGISQGAQTRRDDLRDAAAIQGQPLLDTLKPYRATAANVHVDYAVAPGIAVSAAMTHLDERRSLLGVRSIEASDFGKGAATDAVTFGASMAFGHGFAINGSATASRTSSPDSASAIRIGAGGLMGTAFAVGMSKDGVIGRSDRVRFSVSQPLTIENGTIDFRSLGVIDRDTGEIGVVTQRIAAAQTRRRFVAEAIYAAPVLGGAMEISAFGRGELTGYEDRAADLPGFMFGGRARMGF